MGFASWIIVAAVFFALAYFMFTRESRLLGRLAVALGGENMSSILGGNYVKLESQGVELQIRLMSGSSDNGALMIIQRNTPPTFRLHISPLSWARRLGNTVGLVEDVTVSDDAFDERYRVKTSDKEEAVAFINAPQRREALEYFFEQGFTDIKLEEDGVCVVKPQNLKSDLDPGVMKRHLEHFERLFPR